MPRAGAFPAHSRHAETIREPFGNRPAEPPPRLRQSTLKPIQTQRNSDTDALAPSTVAFRVRKHIGWHFLETATLFQVEFHRPTCASEEAGLMDILAQHRSALRWRPRIERQHGVLSKRPDPDECVVPPIDALGTQQPTQTRTVERGLRVLAALHDPGEERPGPKESHERLDERRAWPAFQFADQAPDPFPGHDTVGVQDQHELVVRTMEVEEMGDVPGLEASPLGSTHQEQSA